MDWNQLRVPGQPVHESLVAALGAELEAAGWCVERVRVTVRHDLYSAALFDVWPAALVAISGGLLLEVAFYLGLGGPDPLRLAAVFGLVMASGLLGHWLRTGSWRSQPMQSTGLAARLDKPAAGAARLVFVTHSDTRPPPSSRRLERWYGRLGWYWLALLWLPCLLAGARPWLARAGPGLLIGLGMLVLVRRFDPWARSPAPYPGDNRTGIAVWRDLALGLPRAVRDALDVRLLCLPAPREHWRDRDQARSLRDWFGADALSVCLEAPGVGQRLLLAGQPSAQAQGLAVARDLWLPVEASSTRLDPDLRELAGSGQALVCLSGERDGTEIDPRLVAAARQWCEELALRWSRSAPPQPPGHNHGARTP